MRGIARASRVGRGRRLPGFAGLAATVVAVLVGASLLAGCAGDGPGPGEARVSVRGSARIERADGTQRLERRRADLARGDRITVVEGSVDLALSGGTVIELRAGFGRSSDSALTMGDVPRLDAGEALVATGEQGRIEAAGTEVVVRDGAVRVGRSLGVSVGTYAGSARLDSAGQVRVVDALREMVVPALGRPPSEVRPLAYVGADPWDRRFLGAAMRLGDRLQRLSDGYTASLAPGEAAGGAFYRRVVPVLAEEAAVDALVDAGRPPGEVLVGATIAALSRGGSFATRYREVFAFRDQGADWGLVALDGGADGDAVVSAIEAAISGSPLRLDQLASGPLPGDPASPQGPAPPAVAPATVTPPGAVAPSPVASAPSTTAPPIASPSPPPTLLGGVLDPVVNGATGLVDGLLGSLLGSG